MSWVIRFFLLFIAFWVFSNLVRSFLTRILKPPLTETRSRTRVRSNQAGSTVTGKMVKDPQCGMYVAEDLAVRAQVQGITVYFCSEQCHNNYLDELKNDHRTDQQSA
ncbi:MAG: hypothetical protein V3R94_03425 [Acidobacteriota bacterium]